MRIVPMTRPETTKPADTTSAMKPIAMPFPSEGRGERTGAGDRGERLPYPATRLPGVVSGLSYLKPMGGTVILNIAMSRILNMSAKEKLLDKAAEQCSPATYKALAERLGISRSLISNWKAGDWPMPQERIAEIARIAHVDAGEWMLLIEAEQAKGEAKKAYGSLVKRLGIAALLGMMATPAWASSGAHQITNAALDSGISLIAGIGIMRSLVEACPCFGYGCVGV